VSVRADVRCRRVLLAVRGFAPRTEARLQPRRTDHGDCTRSSDADHAHAGPARGARRGARHGARRAHRSRAAADRNL